MLKCIQSADPIFVLRKGIMIIMIGIYFSGTGNSRYAAELFCREYEKETRVCSIEDDDVLTAVLEIAYRQADTNMEK